MLRKVMTLLVAAGLLGAYGACAENEHKMEHKTEVQRESPAQDVSPGEMTVD
jgi:hypothetical protein